MKNKADSLPTQYSLHHNFSSVSVGLHIVLPPCHLIQRLWDCTRALRKPSNGLRPCSELLFLRWHDGALAALQGIC